MLSLSLLPRSASTLITSTYSVPSFEDAVALCLQCSLSSQPHAPHAITITLHPLALRFTIVDDGPAMSPSQFQQALLPQTDDSRSNSTPHLPSTIQALSAIANTSAVELRIRTSTFSALKTVQASRCLETRSVPLSSASTLLKIPGMQLDVWETFSATPVRRRIEQQRSSDSLTFAVRQKVVCLALANPRTAITLRVDNNVVLLRTPRASRLTLDHVSVAFDDDRANPWVSLSIMHNAVSIVAFASRPGLPHTRAQLVTVDGFPAPNSVLYHLLSRAWRVWFNRASEKSVAARRQPAFVVNVTTGFRRSSLLIDQHPLASSSDLEDKNLEQKIFQSVTQALSEEGHKGSSRMEAAMESREVSKQIATKNQLSNKNNQQKEVHQVPLSQSNKRKRFEDADMTIRPDVRMNGSACGATATPLSRLGYFNCPHACVNLSSSKRSRYLRTPVLSSSPSQRLSSCSSNIRAADIGRVLSREIPDWCGPCIVSGITTTSTIAAKSNEPAPKPSSQPSQWGKRDNESIDKRRVDISKANLQQMRVVGQADKKFIIAMSEGNGTLYALDQHAVSERVLYERLIHKAQWKGIQSKTLKDGVTVKVSQSQRHILTEKTQGLERWGWKINADYAVAEQLEITHVPRVCGLNVFDVVIEDPIDLVGYADELLDGTATGCIPKVIMDAMASVACHSAVRFGDELSKEQCQHLLLDGLSACDNPFVCAHGRPSVVPLVLFRDR